MITMWSIPVAVVAVCASTLLAQPRDLQAELRHISESAQRIQSARIVAFSSTNDHASAQGFDIVLESGGRFAARYFNQAKADAPSSWDTEPYYFAFFDGTTIRSARGTRLVYEEGEVDTASLQRGLVQQIYCPWPLLPQLAKKILADPLATFELTEEGAKAQSIAAGLSIGWSATQDVLWIKREVDSPGVSQKVAFSSFTNRSGVRLPGTVREVIRTGVVRNGVDLGSDVTYTIRAIHLNPADTEQLLSFDSVKPGLLRYDLGTQNVYSAEGTLMYNEAAGGPLGPTGWSWDSPRLWA